MKSIILFLALSLLHVNCDTPKPETNLRQDQVVRFWYKKSYLEATGKSHHVVAIPLTLIERVEILSSEVNIDSTDMVIVCTLPVAPDSTRREGNFLCGTDN